MRTITTILDKNVKLTDGMYFVTMTDRFLSGWGMAEGRIAKRVIICENFKQARRLADGIRNTKNSGMAYINITDKAPRYTEKKYITSWDEYGNQFLWLSNTQIPE